jgi:small subunit ribosomal protein S20
MAQGAAKKVKKRKKSVLKNIRQAERRRTVNRANITRVRSAIRELRSAIRAGDAAQARQLLSATISVIDRGIQKGALTHNTADRYKSRLSLAVNAMARQPA